MELHRAGFAIEVASPRGGAVPIDPYSDPRAPETTNPDDMVSLGFLASPGHAAKIASSTALSAVEGAAYDAVFVAGGTGAIFDLATDPDVARILGAAWDSGHVVSTVCHGGAALLGARRADGSYLVDGQVVTAFDSDEERQIQAQIPSYQPPVWLEEALPQRGATFVKAGPREPFAVVSGEGRLITGQNNNSGHVTGLRLLEALTGTARRTVKMLATDRLLPGVTVEQVRPLLREEAAHAWSLMKAGVIRENYMRASGRGAVVVLECGGVAEAERIMAGFPLVKAGLIAFDFTELAAFSPLESLFAEAAKAAQ